VKGCHLHTQYEETILLVVGARASSYCRYRQNTLGLREARHRSRSGRKPQRYTEPVNGSLTSGELQARKRTGSTRGKRGVVHLGTAILIT